MEIPDWHFGPLSTLAGPESERIRCCGGWFSSGASRCSCWATRCPPAGARWRSSAAGCKCPVLLGAPGEGWEGQWERPPGWGAAEGSQRSLMLLARVKKRGKPVTCGGLRQCLQPRREHWLNLKGRQARDKFSMSFHKRERRISSGQRSSVCSERKRLYFQDLGRFWNAEDYRRRITRKTLREPGDTGLCAFDLQTECGWQFVCEKQKPYIKLYYEWHNFKHMKWTTLHNERILYNKVVTTLQWHNSNISIDTV